MTSPRQKRVARGLRPARAVAANPAARFHQAVARRAYELYVKRGQRPGHEVDDWLEAEREVRNSRTGVRE